MKDDNCTHIAVVDTSAIVRSGVTHVIKHVPGNGIHTVEIDSAEGLSNYLSLHTPDIVVVNPIFEGWFDVARHKAECPDTKFVALLYSVIAPDLLKNYDAEISITEDMESIISKLTALTDGGKDEAQPGQDSLSQREREIVTCIVKGMTNKEIADKLFISIHTVVTHRRNISRKLQIHSPAGLTIYAIVNKLVDVHDVSLQ